MAQLVAILSLPDLEWTVREMPGGALAIRGLDAQKRRRVYVTLSRTTVETLVEAGIVGLGDGGLELFSVERLCDELRKAREGDLS